MSDKEEVMRTQNCIHHRIYSAITPNLYPDGIDGFKRDVNLIVEKLDPYFAKAYQNHLAEETVNKENLIPVKSSQSIFANNY